MIIQWEINGKWKVRLFVICENLTGNLYCWFLKTVLKKEKLAIFDQV